MGSRQVVVLSRRVTYERVYTGRRYELCDRTTGRRELLDTSQDDYGEGAGETSYDLTSFRVNRRAVTWLSERFAGAYERYVVVFRQHRSIRRVHLPYDTYLVGGQLALDGAGRVAFVMQGPYPLATQTLIAASTVGEQRRLDSGQQISDLQIQTGQAQWNHTEQARSLALRQPEDRCPSPFASTYLQPLATTQAVASGPSGPQPTSQACLRDQGLVQTIPGTIATLAGPYAATFAKATPPTAPTGPMTIYDLRTGQPAGPTSPLASEGQYGRLLALDPSGAAVLLRDGALIVRALDGTERELDQTATSIVLDDGQLSWTSKDGQPHATQIDAA